MQPRYFPKNRHRFRPLIISLLILAASLAALKLASTRVILQVTGSLPKGIYAIHAPTRIKTGQLVVFDVPRQVRDLVLARGWIPAHLRYHLLKPVVAVPGDSVVVCEKGLFINGDYFGAVKKYDSRGLALPKLDKRYVLKAGEYFTACRHDDSFDGRYFGPIIQKSILAVAAPLLVFN